MAVAFSSATPLMAKLKKILHRQEKTVAECAAECTKMAPKMNFTRGDIYQVCSGRLRPDGKKAKRLLFWMESQ